MRIGFGCEGRHGDIIQASLIANWLIALGHSLRWVTIKYYEELVRCVCPAADVVLRPFPEGIAWSDELTTDIIRSMLPDCHAHINAHFGSREGTYWGSGMHPVYWLREKVQRVTGIRLGNEVTLRRRPPWRELLVYKNPKEIDLDRRDPEKPLAIIAPFAITSQSITPEMLESIYARLSRDYETRLLVSSKPQDESYDCISGYTFADCIKILRMADCYVGQDSGMSWGSLYSPCRKEIYHTWSRFRDARTSFAAIDPKAREYFR